MNLLNGKIYDPAASVNKVTTAALAMTALDTANLRLAITVPAHGFVRFRLAGTLHGAATLPQIVLGVMNGAAIVGRASPMVGGSNLAATSLYKVEADFVVGGLAPGAMNVDAAYGVETLVAATGLKYGGANNATANDAFGGFSFEAWDPMPIVNTAATGPAQVTADATRQVTVGAFAANSITAAAIANAAIDAATFAAGAIDAAAFAQGAADKVWGTAIRLLTAGTNIVLAKGVGVTGFNDLDAVATRAAVGLAVANLDVQFAALDADVLTRLAAVGYTAPDNAGIAAIKAKTNSLTFTIPGFVDSNIQYVNDIEVAGNGQVATPWGPV